MSNVNFKYRYNSDDIFLRSVFAALTETLTNRISYKQTESDTVRKTIEVPFVLRATGDERFLQYYFSGEDRKTCEKFIEGSFDKVPRGVLSLTGFNIDRSQLTSGYARTRLYETDDDGNIREYSAEVMNIPQTISFDVKIICDTMNEAMKIYQNIQEVFYFNQKFNFVYKGIVCPANANFPDSIPLEGKTYEFNYGSPSERPTLSLTLDVMTHLPVVNESTRYSKDKVIKKFENSVQVADGVYEDFDYEFTGILSGKVTYTANNSPYLNDLFLYDNKNVLVDSATPNGDGEYLFVNVPAKINYKLKDSANTSIATGISILPGNSNSVDVEIED